MTEIISKERIEREAREAAARGDSLDAACPYPWHSPAGKCFKTAFLRATSTTAEPTMEAEQHV